MFDKQRNRGPERFRDLPKSTAALCENGLIVRFPDPYIGPDLSL